MLTPAAAVPLIITAPAAVCVGLNIFKQLPRRNVCRTSKRIKSPYSELSVTTIQRTQQNAKVEADRAKGT